MIQKNEFVIGSVGMLFWPYTGLVGPCYTSRTKRGAADFDAKLSVLSAIVNSWLRSYKTRNIYSTPQHNRWDEHIFFFFDNNKTKPHKTQVGYLKSHSFSLNQIPHNVEALILALFSFCLAQVLKYFFDIAITTITVSTAPYRRVFCSFSDSDRQAPFWCRPVCGYRLAALSGLCMYVILSCNYKIYFYIGFIFTVQ